MSVLLPFNQTPVDGKYFEAFCLRIAEREPDIQSAELKKPNPQYGVDIEGYSSDNKPILLVQCKRQARVGQSEIRKWNEDF